MRLTKVGTKAPNELGIYDMSSKRIGNGVMTALVLPITAKVHLKIRKYLGSGSQKSNLEGVHGFISANGSRVCVFVLHSSKEVLTYLWLPSR